MGNIENIMPLAMATAGVEGVKIIHYCSALLSTVMAHCLLHILNLFHLLTLVACAFHR